MDGRVTLLGAGPGNPELLTLIGKRRLHEADVVLYDRLIDPSLLAFANDKATLIDVGKMPLHHKVKQSKINEMLVDYAQQGQKVVRLKAGDPYVFGRGGEEAQILKAARVSFEVIPGITSAIAGLAAAGIPITHRDYASSFHIITGHHKQDGHQLDWDNIAKQEGTLVFLMGMAQLSNICHQLIEHGKAATTPVAIIQWATQWRQKIVTGDLTNISDLVQKHQLSSPALIVVGEVVRLSAELNTKKPLTGVHVLVPFSSRQRLFNCLEDLGATADFYQRQTSELESTALPADLDSYSTIIIDDLLAYQSFLKLLIQQNRDLRSLAKKKVIAGNQRVAKQLQCSGLLVDDVMPSELNSKSILELGGEHANYHLGKFLRLYHKKPANAGLPFNLDEFDAVIFPSTTSLTDFWTLLDRRQKDQLSKLTAFTMGQSIQKAIPASVFAQVINCPPQIEQTIQKIKEEFVHD